MSLDAEAQALADALANVRRVVQILDRDVEMSAMGRQEYAYMEMLRAKWPVYRELYPKNTDIKIERGRIDVCACCSGSGTGLRYTWLV